MKNNNGLTKQQQSFADYHRSHPGVPEYKVYQKYYNPKSVASAKAGASRLLTNVNLLAYLEFKRGIAEKKADIEQDQWISEQLEILNIALGRQSIKKTLILDKELITTDVYDPSLSSANKAIETLGKFKRWLSDKGGINVGVAIHNNQPMVFIPASMDEGND